MRKSIVTAFFSLVLSLSGQDWHNAWERSGSTWYEKWTNTMDSIGLRPENERIEILGAAVRIGDSIQRNEQEEIFKRAQRLLLSIPGHAEHYEKAIKDLQFKLESAPKGDKWKHQNDYGRLQWDSFQILSHLPSPETVRVLGDFLSDEKGGIDFSETGPNPTEGQIMAQQKKNCAGAALALVKLISNPPVKKASWLMPDAVAILRQWYDEVKNGKRTFRFEGDPTEYDLNGPAPKEKLQRIERDLKRDNERAAGHKKSSSTPESGGGPAVFNKPISIAGIVAAVALCAAAVWHFVRSRKLA